MEWYFWIVLIVLIKIPMAMFCYVVYWAIKQAPEQVLGDSDGGHGVSYVQGPRKRGPQGDHNLRPLPERRASSGHGPGPRPPRVLDGTAPGSRGARRGGDPAE